MKYRMSRNIGDDFNLAVWQILAESSNLKIANFFFGKCHRNL